jgi:transcription elongation factor SPT5
MLRLLTLCETNPNLLIAGIETLGGKYELHDLVQLDANTAGVIIGIDKDYARVLSNQSTVAKPDVRMCKVGGQQPRCKGCECVG